MRALVTLIATTALAVALLAPAHAEPVATPAQLAGVVAAQGTPNVLNGAVLSMAQVGPTMVLGGSFTKVREAGSRTTRVRRSLVAFDATSGRISRGFHPTTNGVVNKVLSAGDGSTVFVAGVFTRIGGVRRQNLARVRIADGRVVRGFNAGAVAGKVRDLALVDGRLWVAGAFTHIAGSNQRALATLNPATGRRTRFVSLAIRGSHHGGTTQVLKIDSRAGVLVAVGNFRTVGRVVRPQLALLDVGGTAARVARWNTRFYAAQCSGSNDTYLRDVDLAPDGRWFVVSTTGGFHGPSSPCDTTARFEVAPSAGAAAVRPSWVNSTGGDTTSAVEVTQDVVYVGGHFRWQNNPYGTNGASRGAVPRSGIAALDPANGLPFNWNPGRTLGVGVFDFLDTPAGLWFASDTDRVNWQLRGRIARMRPDGLLLPVVRQPGATGLVFSSAAGGTRLAQQSLTDGALGAREPSLAGEGWNTLRAAFMVNGTLFHVGPAPTLLASSFDGMTLGTAREVTVADTLVPVEDWRSDLRAMTGMVLDAGRLYYTRRGDPRLFYRYFNPQSGVVGALRKVADLSGGPLDYARARGLFLAGDRLHWVDVAGLAWSAPWQRTAQAGHPVRAGASPVSTPAPATPIVARFVFQGAEGAVAPSGPFGSGAQVRELDHVATATARGRGHVVRLRMPTRVRAGDRLVLHAATSSAGRISSPRGWTAIGSRRSLDLAVRMWTRRATAQDAGDRVRVRFAKGGPARLTVVAYRSADGQVVVLRSRFAAAKQTSTARPPSIRTTYGNWVTSVLVTSDAGRIPRPTQPRGWRLSSGAQPAVAVVDTGRPVVAGRWLGAPLRLARRADRVVGASLVLGVR